MHKLYTTLARHFLYHTPNPLSPSHSLYLSISLYCVPVVSHVTENLVVSFIIYTTLMKSINMRNMTGLGDTLRLKSLTRFALERALQQEGTHTHTQREKARQHFWG